jgi:peptidyl-dipeptidase A
MHIKSALLAVALLPVFAVAQTSQTAAPTVAEAQAFMDKAEADLLALTNEAGRAQWVQETFITDDTEAIAAKANERLLNRTNELVIGARRFKGMKLPPDLDRKFMLLRLNASPTDPKLVAELTQVSSALDGV